MAVHHQPAGILRWQSKGVRCLTATLLQYESVPRLPRNTKDLPSPSRETCAWHFAKRGCRFLTSRPNDPLVVQGLVFIAMVIDRACNGNKCQSSLCHTLAFEPHVLLVYAMLYAYLHFVSSVNWRQFWTNAGGGLAGKEDVHLADVCGISETAIRSSFIETTWEWSLRELEKNIKKSFDESQMLHAFSHRKPRQVTFSPTTKRSFCDLFHQSSSNPFRPISGTHQFVDVFGLLRREQKDQALTSKLLEWCSHDWSNSVLSRINVGLTHRHPSLNRTKTWRVFT